MKKHSIVIIEDHLFFRIALLRLLGENEKLDIAATFSSAEEALERLPTLDAELALIDVSLPNMNGIEFVSQLAAIHPHIHCVILSGHMNRSYVKRALEAGAHGYILKDDVNGILEGVQKVIDGEIFISEALRNY